MPFDITVLNVVLMFYHLQIYKIMDFYSRKFKKKEI